MRLRWLLKVVFGLFAVLAAAFLGFFVWANATPKPMPEALAALAATSDVEITTSPWLTFNPAGIQNDLNLILYPGGRVDPRAYAPVAAAIASEGYRVIITPMPLNLAVFAPDLALEVFQAYPEGSRWVLAGHSLGGAMAARFAVQNPDALAGLVLWAAYPAGTDSLAGSGLPVMSIYGTHDGLASPEQVLGSSSLLPVDAEWVEIEGGNHAQFGWYGPQPGDNPPAISREEQQTQLVAAMLLFLEKIAGGQ